MSILMATRGIELTEKIEQFCEIGPVLASDQNERLTSIEDDEFGVQVRSSTLETSGETKNLNNAETMEDSSMISLEDRNIVSISIDGRSKRTRTSQVQSSEIEIKTDNYNVLPKPEIANDDSNFEVEPESSTSEFASFLTGRDLNNGENKHKRQQQQQACDRFAETLENVPPFEEPDQAGRRNEFCGRQTNELAVRLIDKWASNVTCGIGNENGSGSGSGSELGAGSSSICDRDHKHEHFEENKEQKQEERQKQRLERDEAGVKEDDEAHWQQTVTLEQNIGQSSCTAASLFAQIDRVTTKVLNNNETDLKETLRVQSIESKQIEAMIGETTSNDQRAGCGSQLESALDELDPLLASQKLMSGNKDDEANLQDVLQFLRRRRDELQLIDRKLFGLMSECVARLDAARHQHGSKFEAVAVHETSETLGRGKRKFEGEQLASGCQSGSPIDLTRNNQRVGPASPGVNIKKLRLLGAVRDEELNVEKSLINAQPLKLIRELRAQTTYQNINNDNESADDRPKLRKFCSIGTAEISNEQFSRQQQMFDLTLARLLVNNAKEIPQNTETNSLEPMTPEHEHRVFDYYLAIKGQESDGQKIFGSSQHYEYPNNYPILPTIRNHELATNVNTLLRADAQFDTSTNIQTLGQSHLLTQIHRDSSTNQLQTQSQTALRSPISKQIDQNQIFSSSCANNDLGESMMVRQSHHQQYPNPNNCLNQTHNLHYQQQQCSSMQTDQILKLGALEQLMKQPNSKLCKELVPMVRKMNFRCHVCQSCFEDRHRLQQHLSIHLNLHPSWFEEKTIKETMAQYELRRGDYLCQICQVRHETTSEYDKHMHLHADKPHQCNLCSREGKFVSFRYFRQLLTHLRSHCFLYSCKFVPECRQTANRKDYLKLHILKHHLNNKLPEQYTICCQ